MRGAARAPMTPARLTLLMGAPVAAAFGAWVWLAGMIGDMSGIPGMSAMMAAPSGGASMGMMTAAPAGASMIGPVQLFGLFVMWAVMMAAMMLPTAAPMILAYARMQAPDRGRGAGWRPVAAFSGGYVLAWAGFSVAAAIAQAAMTELALMSPMMMKASAPVGGGILVLAGVWQFSPLKQACLRQCRTPLSFLMTQWRDGAWGALGMGWRHGGYCVGCCWAMMGLLFVFGVMNPAWIVAITAYVLIEKIIPRGARLSKLVGMGMVCLGGWIIV